MQSSAARALGMQEFELLVSSTQRDLKLFLDENANSLCPEPAACTNEDCNPLRQDTLVLFAQEMRRPDRTYYNPEWRVYVPMPEQQCTKEDCLRTADLYEKMAMPMPTALASVVYRHLGVDRPEEYPFDLSYQQVQIRYMDRCVTETIETYRKAGGPPHTLLTEVESMIRNCTYDMIRPKGCERLLRMYTELAMPMPAPLRTLVCSVLRL